MENYNIVLTWNGPELRQVQLVNADTAEVVSAEHVCDGLICDPCDPPCEGNKSMCCNLYNQVIEFGPSSGPANTLFHMLRQSIMDYDNCWGD